jgi:hypothetical protein
MKNYLETSPPRYHPCSSGGNSSLADSSFF